MFANAVGSADYTLERALYLFEHPSAEFGCGRNHVLVGRLYSELHRIRRLDAYGKGFVLALDRSEKLVPFLEKKRAVGFSRRFYSNWHEDRHFTFLGTSILYPVTSDDLEGWKVAQILQFFEVCISFVFLQLGTLFGYVIECWRSLERQNRRKTGDRVTDREVMLERVRKALDRTGKAIASNSEPRLAHPPKLEGIMPPIAAQELLPVFEAELQKVGGSAYRAANLMELEDMLRRILASWQANAVVLSRNPLLRKLGLQEKMSVWGKSVAVWSDAASAAPQEKDKEEEAAALQAFAAASFSATVGITGVDFALAESGSLVLTSRTEGSQLASVAPPIHVALYRRNQLVASLEEVLEQLPVSPDPNQPSPGRSVVFITGTSRTADIEQILIRGVHGPREVHAILVEDFCLGREGSALP